VEVLASMRSLAAPDTPLVPDDEIPEHHSEADFEDFFRSAHQRLLGVHYPRMEGNPCVRASLLPRPPHPRTRRSPEGREGHRTVGASASGEGPAPAGQASAVTPPRPDPAGRGQPSDAEEPVVLVRGHARDPSPVAPGAHRQEVGHTKGEVAPAGHRSIPMSRTSSSASAGRTRGGATSGSAASC
jgi:hypothetical protein